MRSKIELDLETKGGESLYIMVYSARPDRNHYEVYKSPEFRAYYVPNNFGVTSFKRECAKALVLLSYAVSVWWQAFCYNFQFMFGSNVFDRNFSNRRWDWCEWYFTYALDHEVIEVVSTFRNQFHFSVKGQLVINCIYSNDHYLNPSQYYLRLRVEELLQEWLVSGTYFDKGIVTEFLQWREEQLSLGNEVYYICSLDT